jgi:hypothetical protein
MIRIVWNDGGYDYIPKKMLPYFVKMGMIAYVVKP